MNRPNFRPVSAPIEADDATLDRLGKALNVPQLVHPDTTTPISEQIPVADKPNPSPGTSPTRKDAPPTSAQKKPTLSPAVKLSAMVPGYVSDAVNLRAAQERSTVRHLVLLGLQAIGFQIAEADLVADRRRPVRKRRSST